MKFASVFSALLLATSAVAAPSKLQQRRHERLQKRLGERRNGFPLAVNYESLNDRVVLPEKVGETVYDSNWAGAVIVDSKITKVSGTFTIPSLTAPSNASSNTAYGASAWVGIDGDTCQTAILQAGIEMIVEGTETAYEAWYEWYPNYSYTFPNFPVAPGHIINATVRATSTTSGTATLVNLSTGQTVSHTFTNEGSEGSLCKTNAEWIVEDFQTGSELVPFANFSTVTFQNASYVAAGATKGLQKATILDVEQNNTVQTNCVVTGGHGMYCNYL